VGHEMYWMAWWKYSMKLKMKHVATIWWVFISSELRWKGVAKQLFEAMLFEIQKEKFTKIQLMVNESQKSAYHFYKKVWFIEVGRLRGELLYNGTYYDELIMEYYFQ
jgi:ribosomal protein S18 acetylase RimI-like enzyme